MKLTGKAQEDFDLWFFERNTPIKEYKNYPNLSETCKNALIVEWFDTIPYRMNQSMWEYLFYFEYRATLFKDYKKATNAAIEKANELYNNGK